LHYSGIQSYTAGAWSRGNFIAAQSLIRDAGVKSATAPERIIAPDRTSRHGFQQPVQIKNTEKSSTTALVGTDAAAEGAALPAHIDRNADASSSSFLAQFIAQEVDPDQQGLEQHQNGSRAYMAARDSTMQILSQSAGLDIFI
jgi:hypothetical protein